MSPGQNNEFTFNGNKCKLSILENCLVIQIPSKDEKTQEKVNIPEKVIPFFEIFSVKVVDNGANQEKCKQVSSIASKGKLPFIAIKTVKRLKDSRWRLMQIKLKSASFEMCEKWIEILENELSKFVNSRPKCLLIFVNPYGGTGSAKNIYERKVVPIFEEAQVKAVVITTDRKDCAKDYVEQSDLADYDGIVAVGGDGTLNEVINGLIAQTQRESGISLNTKKGIPRDTPKYQRPSLKVGVIPAGSTDCVSYVTQGINDAETSAIHIVLGDSHPVDVVSLHNEEGVLKQFSMSLTGYGYFGDMLRKSESYRWLGPPRYSFVGTNVFIKNKSYSGEVHYLPADIQTDPRESSFCRAPCSICQSGLQDTEKPLFTPVTPNQSFTFSDYQSENIVDNDLTGKPRNFIKNRSISESFKSLHDSNSSPPSISKLSEKNEECEDMLSFSIESQPNDDVKEECEKDGSSSGRDSPQSPTTRPNSLDIATESKEESGSSNKWKVIKGDFMSVAGVVMSCACERSPLGLSPHSHLSDGAIDLIVVKACSRFDFLRFMISHAGKGDRFDFPFVEVQRVKAFQFIPSTSEVIIPELPDMAAPSPCSVSTEASGAVHLSFEEMTAKFSKKREKSQNKKQKKSSRKIKRSQSVSSPVSSPVSTWNSDGEVIRDANLTVRVHRGLIKLFCRGIESTDTK